MFRSIEQNCAGIIFSHDSGTWNFRHDLVVGDFPCGDFIPKIADSFPLSTGRGAVRLF